MAFFGVRAVESTHHIAVYHVHHGLGGVSVPTFDGRHTFLNQEVLDFQAFFDDRHFVALFAV